MWNWLGQLKRNCDLFVITATMHLMKQYNHNNNSNSTAQDENCGAAQVRDIRGSRKLRVPQEYPGASQIARARCTLSCPSCRSSTRSPRPTRTNSSSSMSIPCSRNYATIPSVQTHLSSASLCMDLMQEFMESFKFKHTLNVFKK